MTGAPQVAYLAGQIGAITVFVNHVFYKRVGYAQGANGLEALFVTKQLALVAITIGRHVMQFRELDIRLSSRTEEE